MIYNLSIKFAMDCNKWNINSVCGGEFWVSHDVEGITVEWNGGASMVDSYYTVWTQNWNTWPQWSLPFVNILYLYGQSHRSGTVKFHFLIYFTLCLLKIIRYIQAVLSQESQNLSLVLDFLGVGRLVYLGDWWCWLSLLELSRPVITSPESRSVPPSTQ